MQIDNIKTPRVSRITIPEHAHPHARLVYKLMRDNCVTYEELEHVSGVLRSTVKSYRNEKTPSLQSIEALLGAFNWSLIPTPPLSSLKPETLEAIEEISLDFVSDNEALAAVMARVCRIPVKLEVREIERQVPARRSSNRKGCSHELV